MLACLGLRCREIDDMRDRCMVAASTTDWNNAVVATNSIA
jgi:predicted aconitase